MIRSRKLRQSAKECPGCQYCYAPNYDGQQLCLAHSNELRHGRGAYHKSEEIFGAVLCQKCHDLCDGRCGMLSKREKREMHRIAHERTLLWWWTNGYLVEGKVA